MQASKHNSQIVVNEEYYNNLWKKVIEKLKLFKIEVSFESYTVWDLKTQLSFKTHSTHGGKIKFLIKDLTISLRMSKIDTTTRDDDHTIIISI